MKRALILSGGGVKGAFEAGFCYTLAQQDFVPDFMIGSSVGALNMALFADKGAFKKNADHARELWRVASRKHLLPFNLKSFLPFSKERSIFHPRGMELFFQKNIEANSFDELNVPVYVNTTRYKEGDAFFFDKGKLLKPLLASLSTPPLLPPVKIKGTWYVDGGINNESMIAKARKLGAKEIIFVNLERHSGVEFKRDIISQLAYTIHLLEKNVAAREYEQLNHKSVIEVKPSLACSNMYFDFENIPTLFRQGEKYARRLLKQERI